MTALGVPRWFTLGTRDLDSASAFYAALFGWTVAETAGGTHFLLDGDPVAALREPSEVVPAGWLPWLEGGDLPNTIDAVIGAGAKLVATTPDGKGALIEDPGEAVFGLGSPPHTDDGHRFWDSNCVMWIEAKVVDHSSDVVFLRKVFDYEFLPPAGPGGVEVFKIDGRGYGGAMSFDDRWEGHREPHWFLYMAVDSVDDAVAAAEASGGSVWFPPFTTPIGRIAYLRDPEGFAFAVTQRSAAGPRGA
ncbi:MAG: VOC family protein [Rhodococcus sp. (in: high G+C Gram-positive bacteria)]|uniref:VOC family protein n=1 Tax=Rhodococcus sp. TaxID=1831 RepID=UPI002ADBDD17|nr:VOC family protein [Rhodococcus sp. (in: high G+C Gram-positive bacteria)]